MEKATCRDALILALEVGDQLGLEDQARWWEDGVAPRMIWVPPVSDLQASGAHE